MLFSSYVDANESCGRTAIVGHQEILVDTSSAQKGEGLRFFLEQDSIALDYLNQYQANTQIQWQNAALGTAGTGLILTGIIGNFSSEARQNFYVTGLSLILVNFLVARTLEMTNERYLLRAIEEYNRRNLPRIHLSPETNLPPISSVREVEHINISLSKTWSF